MDNYKLCLSTFSNWEFDDKEQIKIFKEVGFDGFFINWNSSVNVKDIKQYADEIGMYFQSIHAPFFNSKKMWIDGSEAKEAVDELLACLNDCAENDVPIMVCHCYIGFDSVEPNEIGVANFLRVVEKAKELGVKIAFENCEQEQFLQYLMNAFKDYDNVGFCWDTGHEMCYNRSKDMMSLYGDRLIATHINDNLGIKSEKGEIIWLDDLHLLPFDGVADWENVAQRLNKYNFIGELTFELTDKSKPDRHENDSYTAMGKLPFLKEAFARACKLKELITDITN